MFKALLIYALTIGAIVAGIAVTMRVPLDTALGVFAIGEVAALSVAVPVLVVRLQPKPRQRGDVQRLSADHVAPPLALPEPQRVIRVERPVPKLIEAPRREIQAP